MKQNVWNGPNSLSASGTVAQPSRWDKAVGYANSLMDNSPKDLGVMYGNKDLTDQDLEDIAAVDAAMYEGSAEQAAEQDRLAKQKEAASKPVEKSFSEKYGHLLAEFGADMAQASAAPRMEAKPFSPKFQPIQQASYAQQALEGLDTTGQLNLNPYGF